MRCPTVKTLLAEFPKTLDRERALLIRRLAKAVDNGEALAALIEKRCPKTHAYARSCYSDPYNSSMWRRTMALHAIDDLLETSGVEALGPIEMRYGPPFEYCNAGDPYVATLIYSRDSDRLFVGSWGDIAERHEREWGEE